MNRKSREKNHFSRYQFVLDVGVEFFIKLRTIRILSEKAGVSSHPPWCAAPASS